MVVGGELFTDYSDHPRKLVTLNPKPNCAPDATSFFPVGGMLYRKQLSLKDFFRKLDAVALQQIKERGALPDWSWWYPSGNRPLQQYLGFTAGRWLWSVRARLTAWLQIQRSGRERSGEIDVWAESPRLSPLWLSASSSARQRAVNHYRDNAITYKAQRDKNARELKLANAAITDMQMRQRVAALDAKYTKELADAKAEKDALRDDVAAGRRRLHISSLSVSVKLPAASGVDNAALPLTGRHRWTGLFHPQREADHYAKTTEPRSILMSSVDRVAHIDGQLMQLLWVIHTRFQRSINA